MNGKRFFVSISVAVVISFIILLALNDFGITWDEPVYMLRANEYVSWLLHPKSSTRDKIFGASVADIHPPFRKLVGGITHEIFTNRLGVVDNTRSYRISSLLFVFPLITVLTYAAIGQFGLAVGVLVPAIFSFLPHVLFLTPLMTLDYATAALWFIAVVTGMKGIRRNVWLVPAGIVTGLAMLTRLHGYLLFVPIVGLIVWLWPKDAIKKIVILVGVAVAVYVAGWPWLWTNTISHMGEYFRLQSVHGGVTEYIFGQRYDFAPWWYTPVMFLTTTPAFVLILFATGTYRIVRVGTIWERFMLFNALYPIVFFSLPGVVRYDWVRLFLPAFPFVALVAGYGAVYVTHIFRKKYRLVALIILIAAWTATLYFSVIRIHPWESAYYNEFVGGAAGANKLGMESEFWGNGYLGVLPWMNSHKSDMMCVPFTRAAVDYYQAMGQIEAGVVSGATGEACRYEIILMRQGYIYRDPYITKLVTTRQPVYSVSLDGVPLVSVYDRTGFK